MSLTGAAHARRNRVAWVLETSATPAIDGRVPVIDSAWTVRDHARGRHRDTDTYPALLHRLFAWPR
jgi:hypothetical protein